VLPELRRSSAYPRCPRIDRQPQLRELLLIAIDRDEEPTLGDEVMLDRCGEVVDLAHRDAGHPQSVDPLLHRIGGEPLIELSLELMAGGNPIGDRGEARIGGLSISATSRCWASSSRSRRRSATRIKITNHSPVERSMAEGRRGSAAHRGAR